MTREHCLKCVKKHIGQALVLMTEVQLGYSSHRWIAVGHLSEAEAESVDRFPHIARVIRTRKKLIELGEFPKLLPVIELIMRIEGMNSPEETNSLVRVNEDGSEELIAQEDKTVEEKNEI